LGLVVEARGGVDVAEESHTLCGEVDEGALGGRIAQRFVDGFPAGGGKSGVVGLAGGDEVVEAGFEGGRGDLRTLTLALSRGERGRREEFEVGAALSRCGRGREEELEIGENSAWGVIVAGVASVRPRRRRAWGRRSGAGLWSSAWRAIHSAARWSQPSVSCSSWAKGVAGVSLVKRSLMRVLTCCWRAVS
jgi:hypothetical protein